MRLVIFGVLEQHFVHVGGCVLEQLVGAAEDDQGDLAVAQHRQLVGFLHQTEFALGERHLPLRTVSHHTQVAGCKHANQSNIKQQVSQSANA